MPVFACAACLLEIVEDEKPGKKVHCPVCDKIMVATKGRKSPQGTGPIQFPGTRAGGTMLDMEIPPEAKPGPEGGKGTR